MSNIFFYYSIYTFKSRPYTRYGYKAYKDFSAFTKNISLFGSFSSIKDENDLLIWKSVLLQIS